MKNNSMLLAIAALILVGATAMFLSNDESVADLERDSEVQADVVPARQSDNNATSYAGVGSLLSDEEIVILESEIIEIRGHRSAQPEDSENAAEHIHSPD